MKTTVLFALVLTACGGSGLTTDDFRATALTFDKVGIAQNDGDTAEPTQTGFTNPGVEVTAVTCHPHLFERTGEVVGRVNRHFFKLVHHVGELIRDNPSISKGGTRTWENVRNGIDRKLTITATVNSDGSITYDFELDIKSTGDFVKVMYGSITHSGPATSDVGDPGSTPVENKGAVSFDFDALASVVTTENARGQITDAFDNVRDPAHGVKRQADITFTNFTPDDGDPHGPRNGSYHWLREPGVGGYFSFQESVVLFCPANPNNLAADLSTVARWYRNTSDGGVHMRSDSMATGGQIPAGDKWIGMTCGNGATTAEPPEGEWLMKEELPSGDSDVFQLFTNGVQGCDAVFGPVPNQHDAANDYDFSKTVTFPGQW